MPKTRDVPQKRSLLEMELEDRFEDLLSGYRFWYEYKVSSAELSTLDEMFIRWVEASPNETSRDLDTP